MKRKSIVAIICFMMCIVIAGCAASSDNALADKLETVKENMPAADDSKDEEKPDNDTENKSDEKEVETSEKDIEIEEVSWNHSDFGEVYDYNTEIYFKLNTGDVITKEIPFGTAVQGKEMLDIDDDWVDEIVIKQYFANSTGEYSVINIYKLTDGEVVEIFPGDDMPELKDELINTEIVYTESRYLLDVTTYQKDDADVSEKYHARLMWDNGAWKEMDSSNTEQAEEETIPEYLVYVKAPDGYANLRTGPGTEYDVICQMPNGAELEVYREDATSKSGKRWLKVAYYREADNEDGYEWLTGWIAESQLEE